MEITLKNKLIITCSTLTLIGFGIWCYFEPGFEPAIGIFASIGGLVSALPRKSVDTRNKFTEDDLLHLREFLRRESDFVTYLFNSYEDIGYRIHDDALERLAHFRDNWFTDRLRSFNSEIRKEQDEFRNCLVKVRELYDINMYDGVGNCIRFDKQNYGYEALDQKKQEAKALIDQLAMHHQNLTLMTQ
ncbi:hypothetical protein CGI23_25220 [Vibrio parahaemolyticus]|nr:hypothetical protein CGI23_25220 [Vibrio parahaemolyticus]